MKPPSTSGITRFNFSCSSLFFPQFFVFCSAIFVFDYNKDCVWKIADFQWVQCKINAVAAVYAHIFFFLSLLICHCFELIGFEKPIASLQPLIKVKGTIARSLLLILYPSTIFSSPLTAVLFAHKEWQWTKQSLCALFNSLSHFETLRLTLKCCWLIDRFSCMVEKKNVVIVFRSLSLSSFANAKI